MYTPRSLLGVDPNAGKQTRAVDRTRLGVESAMIAELGAALDELSRRHVDAIQARTDHIKNQLGPTPDFIIAEISTEGLPDLPSLEDFA